MVLVIENNKMTIEIAKQNTLYYKESSTLYKFNII